MRGAQRTPGRFNTAECKCRAATRDILRAPAAGRLYQLIQKARSTVVLLQTRNGFDLGWGTAGARRGLCGTMLLFSSSLLHSRWRCWRGYVALRRCLKCSAGDPACIRRACRRRRLRYKSGGQTVIEVSVMPRIPATCIFACLGALFSSAAHSQGYPTKSVRYIVPSLPGGGSDILGRMMAAHMSQTFKQQVDGGQPRGRRLATSAPRSAPKRCPTATRFSRWKRVTHAINATLYRKNWPTTS